MGGLGHVLGSLEDCFSGRPTERRSHQYRLAWRVPRRSTARRCASRRNSATTMHFSVDLILLFGRPDCKRLRRFPKDNLMRAAGACSVGRATSTYLPGCPPPPPMDGPPPGCPMPPPPGPPTPGEPPPMPPGRPAPSDRPKPDWFSWPRPC